MHPPHEVPERVIDQPMLLDEPQAGKGRGSHLDVEMIPLTRGVAHGNRGSGQRGCQAPLDLRDVHHRVWLAPGKSWRKAGAGTATHFGTQTRDGLSVLVQLQVWFELGWSVSTRKAKASPEQSRNTTPWDFVNAGSPAQSLE